ncbi:hypothetical protein UFOVP855_10 [uncultured Caudovirales phage]|jgi:hypothetical protein|uniref:Uncharacterized protein n=1 Tax=uncultured Caudovirales phage TaxID=2100421 RepID=A0A6J5PBK5_9CAUD|nr:hypothetical protein UFOVP527_40 [uncultured Caudovirales phage]CAB4167266.1 hypothetical protein UFOVP855_10 [uncultured Caudovirales phage]CAB4173560.1 hypothetical protein UFOVP954_11 [uncultured Caudovirales phage]CAB4179276.1 hypothetical protein UFOVP1026_50 [uncultured Caudovirales phage]CAB4188554.1 hypothetical protein UFOVP1180_34 [uncultured Caudovirales phage]
MSAFYGNFDGTSKALTESLFIAGSSNGGGAIIPEDALLTEDSQPILLESDNYLSVD